MIRNIGIVGGGQLGEMLTEAAHPLGFQVTVLEKNLDCPAARAGARVILGGLQDPNAIEELARITNVVTWEIEHIDANALRRSVGAGYNVEPSPDTLFAIQDKYEQKQMLERAGLPVAPFIYLDDHTGPAYKQLHLEHVQQELGGAIIIKTRRGGYDGRGNLVFDGDATEVDNVLGPDWTKLYAEKIIPFDRELAVVVARDVEGNVRPYPTVETVHVDNICHTVVSPAGGDPKVSADAQEVARETMKVLGGAGVFAIEMFATADGVMINEIAPRVHNSGHLTMKANETSQFEQHIRAITGMPLGSVARTAPAAAMINILGTRVAPFAKVRRGLDRVLGMDKVFPHFYGKDSRPARKIGHITVLGETTEEALDRAELARSLLWI